MSRAISAFNLTPSSAPRTFIERNGQLYYGQNFNYPVFNRGGIVGGKLSDAFKKRFKDGEVAELPSGWLFNTHTARFIPATPTNIRKYKKDGLESNHGILMTKSINHYDVDVQMKDNGLTRAIILRHKEVTRDNDAAQARQRYPSSERGAFNNDVYAKTYYNLSEKDEDVPNLNMMDRFVSDLLRISRAHGSFKATFSIIAIYTNHGTPLELGFTAPAVEISSDTVSSLKNAINTAKANIIAKIVSLNNNDAYQKFHHVKSFQLKTIKWVPLRGSSYIPTPKFLAKKHCLINIQNDDALCFKYSVLCGLHINDPSLKKDPQRVTKYAQWADELDFTGISFPVKAETQTINHFERLNDISVNIYVYDDVKKVVSPYVVSRLVAVPERQVDLLLLTEENKNNHYLCVKSLSGLLSTQYNADQHTKHFCRYCLHGFTTAELLERHTNNGCASFGLQRTVMPEEGKNDTISYKSHMTSSNRIKEHKNPFIIYADFESVLQPFTEPDTQLPKKQAKKKGESYTKIANKHLPCGYTLYAVSNVHGGSFKTMCYRGKSKEDVMDHFHDDLKRLETKIFELLQKFKSIEDMHITPEQANTLKTATHCSICKEPFRTNDVRHRDHDHATGEFRGIAHAACNVNLNWKNWKIPVVFHNLKNYDSHFIISTLNKTNAGYKGVNVIANTAEKFMSFSFNRLRFIDSFAFLPSSLETLVINLKKDCKTDEELCQKFKHTANLIGDVPNKIEKIKLATQKGVYPYEYMDSFERFDEKQLPPIGAFFSKLSNEGITKEDYAHAQKVWAEFGFRTMGEYHDFYLKTDVVLLADVFESFRNIGANQYSIDPAHYLTLPAYAWDVMLKKTGVTLKLLTDVDMHIFIERSKRGGVSVISQRYAKANNKFMGDKFDIDDVISFITYLDANNLYGWAMCEHLPTGGFEWVSVDGFDLQQMNANESVGYFIECDFHFPEELHDLHSDLPMAPENIVIGNEMLSPWQEATKKRLDLADCKVPKLTPNLNAKTKYVLHSRNLAYYMSQGAIVTKVHKVLKFNQSRWLKQYIDMNTTFRAAARNDFEKDFYKLMNNAVFGKTMEDIRTRVDYELITDKKRLEKVGCSPRLANWDIIRKENGNDLGLVGARLSKSEVFLNKPIYVGCAILDLSKIWMYQFHYGFIKAKYGNRARLLFTDTDSLCYHIQTDDLFSDFKENGTLFDFDGMPKDHVLHLKDNPNKKVLGKFKMEECGKIITEFVGLRAKMYSLKFADCKEKHICKPECKENCDEKHVCKPECKEKHTCKGIKKSAASHITHTDYLRCLQGKTEQDAKQYAAFHTFRSTHHEISTIEVNKISLCSYDDKRYIIDGVCSLPYGHYKTRHPEFQIPTNLKQSVNI